MFIGGPKTIDYAKRILVIVPEGETPTDNPRLKSEISTDRSLRSKKAVGREFRARPFPGNPLKWVFLGITASGGKKCNRRIFYAYYFEDKHFSPNRGGVAPELPWDWQAGKLAAVPWLERNRHLRGKRPSRSVERFRKRSLEDRASRAGSFLTHNLGGQDFPQCLPAEGRFGATHFVLNRESGREIWTCKGLTRWVNPTPVTGHGLLFVTSNGPGRQRIPGHSSRRTGRHYGYSRSTGIRPRRSLRSLSHRGGGLSLRGPQRRCGHLPGS